MNVNAYYTHLQLEELVVGAAEDHLMVVNMMHMRSKKGLMIQPQLNFHQNFLHSPIWCWLSFEPDLRRFEHDDALQWYVEFQAGKRLNVVLRLVVVVVEEEDLLRPDVAETHSRS